MWARASYLLRGALPGAGRLLASWKLSVVLMVTAAAYYAHLAVFARASPAEVIQNIAALAPFWGIYALLLLNTGWCLWLRLPLLRRELSVSPPSPGQVSSWELPAVFADLERARAGLRRLGFVVRPAADGGLWGLKHRWSGLGTYLFHGSFFVVAAGFVTTLAFREEYRVVAAVGEDFVGAPDQVLSREGSPLITRGPPEVRFNHERLEPAFWGDQLLFTQLRSTLRFEGEQRAQTQINRPLWLGFGTFLRLSGFGYAPRFELRSSAGKVLESSFKKLAIFPPGQRDSFRPERYPHRFYLQLYPDLVEEEGQPTSRTLNLVNPGFQVHALRGRVDLGEKLLHGGEEAFVFESLELRFPEVRYWGEFKILRDPGAPILGLGFLMALAGLGIKLRGRRADVCWRSGEGGAFGVLRGFGGEAPSGASLTRAAR